jgi:hypothetical protein
MIIVEGGIDIGPGIVLGTTKVFAVFFVAEDDTTFLVSETDQNFIED